MKHLEGLLSKFRSAEAYQSVIDNLKVETKQQYDLLNINQLQLDEREVLSKNLDYLAKARKKNIETFLWCSNLTQL